MASRRKLKFTVSVALIALGWLGGYFAGRGRAPTGTLATAAARTSPGTTAARNASPAAPAVRSPASPAGALVPVPGSFEALTRDRGLLQRSNALGKAFPDTEAGHRLVRVATLLSFGPAPRTAEGSLVGQQLSWLQEHPEAAFQGIRQGLPLLGTEYAQERRYLVQLAGKLEIDEQVKSDFLAGELRRPATAEQIFDNAAALSALMQSSRSPEDVESALRQALQAQLDPHAREVLLSVYAAREPERGQRLKTEFEP